MKSLKTFALEVAIGLMGGLTLFLCAVAVEGDVLSGWVVWYAAGMGFVSLVLMVFGFGGSHE